MEIDFEPTMSPGQREWYIETINRRCGFDVPKAVQWGLDNGTLQRGAAYVPRTLPSTANSTTRQREGWIRGATDAAAYLGIPVGSFHAATKAGKIVGDHENGRVIWYAIEELEKYAATLTAGKVAGHE